MPAFPGLAPRYNPGIVWRQTPLPGQPALGNGRANIVWQVNYPIPTYGAQQIALHCWNLVNANSVVLQIAWTGDEGVGATYFVTRESSLTSAAAAAGFQRFTLATAEYVVPPDTTGWTSTPTGALETGYVLWLPAAAHYLYLGAYSDGAPTANSVFAVAVGRQWQGNFRNGQ